MGIRPAQEAALRPHLSTPATPSLRTLCVNFLRRKISIASSLRLSNRSATSSFTCCSDPDFSHPFYLAVYFFTETAAAIEE
jgi:hypothetical protein